jgi:hypothetical protein
MTAFSVNRRARCAEVVDSFQELLFTEIAQWRGVAQLTLEYPNDLCDINESLDEAL